MPIGPMALPGVRDRDTPERIRDAAQQFEALLLGQILRATRESGGGWMGSQDTSSDSAVEYAEQQFATVMARNGGLGLATLIMRGLGPQK